MQAARLTDQPYTRPKVFDLAAYWEASKAQFVAALPRYSLVTVRVDPAILPRLRQAGHFVRVEQVELPEAEGWAKVQLQFELEAEACGFILGFGGQLEVLEPVALREKVIRLAEGAVSLYRRRGEPARTENHGFERNGKGHEPVEALEPVLAGS